MVRALSIGRTLTTLDVHALKLAGFGLVFVSQLAHLAEHILLKVTGSAFVGAAANSEETHLFFNGLVAACALALVWAFPRNLWVYLLGLLAVLHGIEHAYTFELYMRTGLRSGPGLFGMGGAIGLIPLDRIELHNHYNGLELILMVLGFRTEIDGVLAREEDSD